MARYSPVSMRCSNASRSDSTSGPHDIEKAKVLVAEAKADGVPVDTQIRLIARTAQFPKIAETIEVMQSEFTEIGLNVKIEMMDTAAQLEYQLRPFPANTGPYLLMIMHGNQAGDAAFTLDQYMLADGPQAAYGTPEFDRKIRAAEELTDEARQDAFAFEAIVPAAADIRWHIGGVPESQLRDAEVYVGSRFDADMARKAQKLRLIHVAGAGTDKIDFAALSPDVLVDQHFPSRTVDRRVCRVGGGDVAPRVPHPGPLTS